MTDSHPSNTIHERSSGSKVLVVDTPLSRAVKQYFDNDYSPSDFLRCQCHRADCTRCYTSNERDAMHETGID